MKLDQRVSFELNIPLADHIGEAAAERGVRMALLESERILVDILSQPGTGRTYKRGSVVHRASAPGEAPAPDTGQLRNSRDTEVLFTAGQGIIGVLSVNADHAAPLQIGTESIAPRPFINKVLHFESRIFGAFNVGAGLG